MSARSYGGQADRNDSCGGRLAYCPQCRRVVSVASERRGKCPACGRVLAGLKPEVMTKGRGRDTAGGGCATRGEETGDGGVD